MSIVIDNINSNINNKNNNNNYNKNDENDNDENKIDDSDNNNGDNNNDINNNKNENNDESLSVKKIIYKNEPPLTLPLPSYTSKYTLILDLDETLIYSQRNISYKLKKKENINKKRIILRPGLREFLKEMKKIFELIIFSSGTADYVNPIVEIIENDEKFFDFVLYRNHITLDEDGNNVKNLDLIGRNIKKIIIIDDIPRYFKLQKDNGINIKPFLGNISSDKNTLKTLAYILKKIRIDAKETNDIRISLKKFKHMLYPDVINSME
jgi:Dullard-like phosphatase family protein